MDDQSDRPLADDLDFLGDLDRGLDRAAPYVSVREPARAPEGPARPLAFSAERPKLRTGHPEHLTDRHLSTDSTRLRRPLLELFPSGPAEDGALPPTSVRPRAPDAAPTSRAARAGPQGPRPVVALDRRPTYEVFYGLNEKPFSLVADPRFLYHSAAHDRAAHEMLNAIERRDATVLLTGPAGSGKTTVCRLVIDELDARTFTSLVLDSFVTIEELLKTVLIDFGVISHADLGGSRLSHASQAALTIALKEFLLSIMPLGAFAVIFVDDAQNLSIEVLEDVRRLTDLERDKQLIQVVLVGEPSLLTRLGRPDVRRVEPRATARFDLEPLTEDEIAGYVLHRLVVSGGGPSRVEFGSDALALIHELSQGNPRLVNRICDRVLTLGYEQSASVIDSPLIRMAAEDLDLIPPGASPGRVWRVGGAAAALVGLVLMGAVAATLVFSARVQRVVAAWQAIPPPPPRPAPRMVRPVDNVLVLEEELPNAGVVTPARSLR